MGTAAVKNCVASSSPAKPIGIDSKVGRMDSVWPRAVDNDQGWQTRIPNNQHGMRKKGVPNCWAKRVECRLLHSSVEGPLQQ